MKKIALIASVCATLFATVPATSFAQIAMPSIPGLSKSDSSAKAADVGPLQTKVTKLYLAANKDVLNANSLMAGALGLKEAAGVAKSTAGALTSGSTQDNLEKANKEVTASSEAIAAELAKGPKLDAKSKAAYSKGLSALAAGTVKYVAVGVEVKSLGENISKAPVTDLPGLASGAYIVSKFPGSVANVVSSLKNAIEFAKTNDIPVPKNATSALGSL